MLDMVCICILDIKYNQSIYDYQTQKSVDKKQCIINNLMWLRFQVPINISDALQTLYRSKYLGGPK